MAKVSRLRTNGGLLPFTVYLTQYEYRSLPSEFRTRPVYIGEVYEGRLELGIEEPPHHMGSRWRQTSPNVVRLVQTKPMMTWKQKEGYETEFGATEAVLHHGDGTRVITAGPETFLITYDPEAVRPKRPRKSRDAVEQDPDLLHGIPMLEKTPGQPKKIGLDECCDRLRNALGELDLLKAELGDRLTLHVNRDGRLEAQVCVSISVE